MIYTVDSLGTDHVRGMTAQVTNHHEFGTFTSTILDAHWYYRRLLSIVVYLPTGSEVTLEFSKYCDCIVIITPPETPAHTPSAAHTAPSTPTHPPTTTELLASHTHTPEGHPHVEPQLLRDLWKAIRTTTPDPTSPEPVDSPSDEA